MRMQIKATGFVANTRRGNVDLTFGGQHQGEAVSVRMQVPVCAAPDLSEAEMLDAAWLRAQQILRCISLVPQPAGQLGKTERTPVTRQKPVRISLGSPAIPHIAVTPIDPTLWS